MEKLLDLLDHNNPKVRANAARTLGELGVPDRNVVIGLLQALMDYDVSYDEII